MRLHAALGGHYGTITEARADRAIGEVLVRWGDTLLVGFENHGGGTYLGPAAQPLGEVIYGHGNCGDGFEGVLLGSAVGTHLRGPCLPKNPQLADFLIGAALARRYGEAQLRPLPDGLEQAAHLAAILRARRAVRRPESRLVRTVLRRPAPGMTPRHHVARGRLWPDQGQRADSRAMGDAGGGATERDLRS